MCGQFNHSQWCIRPEPVVERNPQPVHEVVDYGPIDADGRSPDRADRRSAVSPRRCRPIRPKPRSRWPGRRHGACSTITAGGLISMITAGIRVSRSSGSDIPWHAPVGHAERGPTGAGAEQLGQAPSTRRRVAVAGVVGGRAQRRRPLIDPRARYRPRHRRRWPPRPGSTRRDDGGW